MTHADLMLTNECLGEQKYEATTTALVMAGLFISFLVEYVTHRVAKSLHKRSRYNDEVIGVMVLEAGIIFHSICLLLFPYSLFLFLYRRLYLQLTN